MDDDTSKAAKVCEDWGAEKGGKNGGKWSWSRVNGNRLYSHPVFVLATYYWFIWPEGGRLECDDFQGRVSAGDFWKIYVR